MRFEAALTLYLLLNQVLNERLTGFLSGDRLWIQAGQMFSGRVFHETPRLIMIRPTDYFFWVCKSIWPILFLHDS